MSWSERQRRMLEMMGLRVWAPEAAEVPPADEGAAAAVAVAPSAAAETRAEPAVAPRPPASARSLEPVAPPPAATGPRAALPPEGEVATPVPAPSRERGAGRAALAQMDWTQLREQVAQCRACALCETRKNTVFGVGHERAHWMIVGEAPGEQEDLRGEPFVGPAGQLLDSMLAALGLSRQDGPAERQVYIANTLKCRPPRNRNPEPSELAQCEPYLQRQIELIQPRIILAMGRFAVQQLLGSSEAIGRLRGRVHEYQGVPLIVTYHPAYLLRNLPDKARAWDDLCLALQTLERAP